MLKGKNLWVALGVGAVAYYLWMQNKKNKVTKVVSAPATNFTGDLGVPEYQNAYGVKVVPISNKENRQRNRERRRAARN